MYFKEKNVCELKCHFKKMNELGTQEDGSLDKMIPRQARGPEF